MMAEAKVEIPDNYEEEFKKIILLFKHQRVYCPEKREMVYLTPLENDQIASSSFHKTTEINDEYFNFLGPIIPEDILHGIVNGLSFIIEHN